MARKAEIRKRQILEHFYQVLIEEGLQGASIGKIARHMGAHKSLLMHYFNTKEEMVIELVDFILERYEEAFRLKVGEIQDPEKRLDAILDTIFGLAWKELADDSAFYACYYLSFRNERVLEHFKNMYIRFRKALVDELRMCMEAEIIGEADPEKLADLLVVLTEGLNVCEIMRDDERQSEEIRRHIKERAMMLLKKGEGASFDNLKSEF